MRKYEKTMLITMFLLLLTGCTRIIDPSTGEIIPDMIIKLGEPWIFGEQGWFSSFIVWPIAQLLNFFASYIGAAVAILIVSLLIRLVTLKLSIQATVQQQKMQALAPEQAKIEEKYRGREDEQAKMQKAAELQKLFQKHEINPLAALGGAFLQLPIMIAMYQAVMRADLIINGTIFGQTLKATPLDGFKTGNLVYITIFLLMSLFQFLQMYLPQYMMKKKMVKRPNQPGNPNSSFMYVSLVMIIFIALRWGVGMSLYWLINAIAQLGQTLYIQNKYVD